MQALPPPPPPIVCVAPEKAVGSSYVVLSGEPAQLDAILAEAKPRWQVEARAFDNGVGFARLKSNLNVPYKEIGGLIFNAQRRRISVSFYTDPPICGLEDQ
jgi:hypothetical protein